MGADRRLGSVWSDTPFLLMEFWGQLWTNRVHENLSKWIELCKMNKSLILMKITIWGRRNSVGIFHLRNSSRLSMTRINPECRVILCRKRYTFMSFRKIMVEWRIAKTNGICQILYNLQFYQRYPMVTSVRSLDAYVQNAENISSNSTRIKSISTLRKIFAKSSSTLLEN